MLARYNLLLRELIKNTSQYHSDFDQLNKANEAIQEVCNFVNAKIKEYDMNVKIADISENLYNEPETFELVAPNRSFHSKHDNIQVVVAWNDIRTYTIFLFSDMMMFCKLKTKETPYKYHAHVMLDGEPFPWVSVLLNKPSTYMIV